MIRNEDALARTGRHECVLEAVASGIEAAHPRTVVPDAVDVTDETLTVGETQYDLTRFDEVLVVGGGNPAGEIALALESILGDHIDGGLVVTDDPAPTDHVDVVAGTHPLPSSANADATSRLLDRAKRATADDLVLVVLGGGGSALLCAPAGAVSVQAVRDLTDGLLASGAPIEAINAVRKHISRLKGGQLARTLAPATTAGIVFSDVVGDRLDVVASGPTVPDSSTYDDAVAVLDRYGIDTPDPVAAVLTRGQAGDRPETPAGDDTAFEGVENHVLATNRTAIDAAAAVCTEAGYTPLVLSDRIEGEASEAGRLHAAIAQSVQATGDPVEPPAAVLSGGETTVTVTGNGTGGPNQEFAVAAATALSDAESVVLAGVDTDGIDGASDVAGAVVDDETITTERAARQALADNDAFNYLSDRDTLIRTGQTGTNVNDLRVVLVPEVDE